MKNEPILRVMTGAPQSVSPDSSTAEAQRVMREHGCHHVPVVEDGRVVGMIGVRELMKALVLRPDHDVSDGAAEALKEQRVGDVMRRDVTVLPHTATLLDAARALAQGGMHALPVVAPGNVLAGIITSTDLAEVLVDGLRHPVEAGEAPAHAPATTALQLTRLHEVYRAALSYLESGRGDLEHGRLLQAVNRARQAMREETATLGI